METGICENETSGQGKGRSRRKWWFFFMIFMIFPNTSPQESNFGKCLFLLAHDRLSYNWLFTLTTSGPASWFRQLVGGLSLRRAGLDTRPVTVAFVKKKTPTRTWFSLPASVFFPVSIFPIMHVPLVTDPLQFEQLTSSFKKALLAVSPNTGAFYSYVL